MAVLNNFFNLVRVLFPRWNFFDEIGYQFILEYRLKDSANWTLVGFKSQRRWFHLFLNPVHNLNLAQINLIEQFARDLQLSAPDEVESLDTFKMVKALACTRAQTTDNFQFRVQAYKHSLQSELYCSKWIKS